MPFRHLLCLLFLTVLSNTPSTLRRACAAATDGSLSASLLASSPNIVLVLADRLEFSYGSETPNLDAIAEEGLRSLHTSCAPARARYWCGCPTLPVSRTSLRCCRPSYKYEHYQGVLGDNVVTVAMMNRMRHAAMILALPKLPKLRAYCRRIPWSGSPSISTNWMPIEYAFRAVSEFILLGWRAVQYWRLWSILREGWDVCTPIWGVTWLVCPTDDPRRRTAAL